MCPKIGCPRGPDPSACRARSCGERARPPRMHDTGAWSRFRARLSAASARRFHQISFPGEWRLVRSTGIEPMSAHWQRAALPLSYGPLCVGAQSRTQTCGARRHLIYNHASLPLEYLCVRVNWCGRACNRPHPRCWRKVDGSNATPCGATRFQDGGRPFRRNLPCRRRAERSRSELDLLTRRCPRAGRWGAAHSMDRRLGAT